MWMVMFVVAGYLSIMVCMISIGEISWKKVWNWWGSQKSLFPLVILLSCYPVLSLPWYACIWCNYYTQCVPWLQRLYFVEHGLRCNVILGLFVIPSVNQKFNSLVNVYLLVVDRVSRDSDELCFFWFV